MIEAVRDLHTKLYREPWYITTGIGDGCIVVFVERMPNQREREKAPESYAGYPVMYKYTKRNIPEAES
jgi:hypothetical protein